MTAQDQFKRAFASDAEATAHAPGRINLIGEHTDYNGGLVLPMPLVLGVEAALGVSPFSEDEIISDKYDGVHRLSNTQKATGAWSDYASGALQAARIEGWIDGPMRCVLSSNLPDGAGLSSSTATIIAVLKAAIKLSNQKVPIETIAKVAQRVEHHHIGVPCGIMDQMIIAAAPPQMAMRLDTQTLKYTLIEIPADWRIAVIHSGITRKLNEGRYAERRAECEQAASAIGAAHLCLLNDEEKQRLTNLPFPLRNRARHAHRDHERVSEAVDAICKRDLEAFGRILNDGHHSLSQDFEVSTPEIDDLVSLSVQHGAAGARLSGGGFGGSIVAVVSEGKANRWRQAMEREFTTARFVC